MSKNTFASAKSATLTALDEAAALDAQIRADIVAATSPKHTAALRELCNQRLRQHGKVAAAVRYLDQCANRPSADPVRAAILRSDAEVYGPVLMGEVFELVDLNDADPEASMLADDVWPAWIASHGIDTDVPAPIGVLPRRTDGKWYRVRPQWLHLCADTLARVAEWVASDLADEQATAAKLRRGAEDYDAAELEQQLQITATLARNAAARAKEALAAKSRQAA